MKNSTSDEQLAEFISQFYDDPLGFVIATYPWDQDPSLQIVELPEPWKSRFPNCKYGPDAWACELLDEIGKLSRQKGFDGKKAVKATRVAVTSGHGVGKSALTAWLVDWIMSTRPYCQGTVTANTASQLASKTWARISSWTKKLINADWFTISTGKGNMFLRSKFSPDDWFFAGITCRENESESFAGQHAAGSSSVYIFDEASAVPNAIWEVAEGGLTDGEPFWFVFGNPTRNSGRFYDCFHKFRDSWHGVRVDSRSVQITNKEAIEEWRKEYGEDSDFFRVRVRGEFPKASVAQFISLDVVEKAMNREPPSSSMRPAIAVVGVDFARFGDDSTAIVTRLGRDATFPVQRFKGLSGPEAARKVISHIGYCLDVLKVRRVVVFGDSGGLGGPIMDAIREKGFSATDVDFGSGADDPKRYSGKRTEMWARMREWLENGGCIPKDEQLKEDLIAPEYQFNDKMQYQLERKKDMKARGLPSPDSADALAMTFAYPINEQLLETDESQYDYADTSFDPFQ